MSDVETPLHPNAYRQALSLKLRKMLMLVGVGYSIGEARAAWAGVNPGMGLTYATEKKATPASSGGGGGEYAYEPAICNCHSCRVGAGYHRPRG